MVNICDLTWIQAEQGFYFIGDDLSDLLKQKFEELIGEHKASPQEVEVVMGRTLEVYIYVLGHDQCIKSHDRN